MSGLAKYLLEEGFKVLGSDIKENKNIARLKEMGAKVFIGHNAENLPENAVVIASTAIREDNPELKKAKELGLEVLHRSDLLARIAKGLCSNKKEYFIGYSGTHGKTTTSGLSSYVLEKAGLKPAFVVGGTIPEVGTNAKSDSGDFFIAELDESDGTIVKYQPEISVINNLEVDHVDFYTDGLKSILDTFSIYLGALDKGSKVLINNDDEGNLKLIKTHKKLNFITFGLKAADYTAKNIKFEEDTTLFDVFYKDEFLTDLKISVPGKHNVYNSLAVLASLNEANVDLEKVKPHFYAFSGMGRRFQLSAEFDNIKVYDDYAHHPTEIKATLSATEAFKNNRIVVVFQPHRFSRLKGLWTDFLESFDNADKVFVTDVYAASEDPIAGIDSKKFEEELERRGISAKYLAGGIDKVAKQLTKELNSGDIVIGVGAGTVTNLGKELLAIKDGAKI